MNDVKEGKICAIIAWIFPIGLIWFLIDENMKKNKFVKFHIKQSLVLVIISIMFSIISVLIGMTGMIPIIGLIIKMVWFIINLVFGLTILVLWIMGLLNAINGKNKELPLVGQYSKYLNF